MLGSLNAYLLQRSPGCRTFPVITCSLPPLSLLPPNPAQSLLQVRAVRLRKDRIAVALEHKAGRGQWVKCVIACGVVVWAGRVPLSAFVWPTSLVRGCRLPYHPHTCHHHTRYTPTPPTHQVLVYNAADLPLTPHSSFSLPPQTAPAPY